MLACEGWKEFWNEAQAVPYAKGKDNFPWAGYDNVKSMKIKADYIVKKQLGGAMVYYFFNFFMFNFSYFKKFTYI